MIPVHAAVWAIAGVAICASVGAALIGADVALMRRIVLRTRSKTLPVNVDAEHHAVSLPATDATRTPGEYGLWVNGGEGHFRLGRVLSDGDGFVQREILDTYGDVAGAVDGRWTGHVFAHAASLGQHYRTIAIPGSTGTREAWLFPAGDGKRWAIHVHGIKSSRASALRSVPVATSVGLTSLVPSFYGDTDGIEEPKLEGATFGVVEAEDIDRALAYAAAHGAEEIVLFGWSMGATVALLLTESSVHRSRISRLVLIGPAVKWRSTIERGMRAAGLPPMIGTTVIRSLQSRWLSQLARMKVPVDLSRLNWLTPDRRVDVPTLVLHSAGDKDSDFAETLELARLNPATVMVRTFPPVGHLMEWNAHRESFESMVREELTQTS